MEARGETFDGGWGVGFKGGIHKSRGIDGEFHRGGLRSRVENQAVRIHGQEGKKKKSS